MGYPSSLLSFFGNQAEAALARKRWHGKGLRCSALISKGRDGRVRIENQRPWQGAFAGAVLGFGLGSAAGMLSLGAEGLFNGLVGPLILFLATISGAGAGWLAVRFLGLGVDEWLIKKYSSLLMAGETVVVLQTSPARMGQAITTLRQAGEKQPPIFLFNARPEESVRREAQSGKLSRSSPLDQPARTTTTHRKSVLEPFGGGEPILRLLDRSERILEDVQRELAEVSRLGQRISQAAEWILDNAYLVQAQIADVRLNLPKKFYHQLPTLTADPKEPRVYRLAEEIVGRSDGYLDRHSIGDFLESRQEQTPLTIGELWAFPLMLKIALIDRLRWLAKVLQQDLCDQQEADFWANRLLVAARLEPNLIFALLAGMAREQPDPSPQFASRLIGHLHDEAATLAPVASWIEQKLATSLDEAVLNEKASQDIANVAIGNVVTSLRLLILLDWREVFDDYSRVERTLAKDPAGVYAGMDFETRNRYRRAVEEISRVGPVDEGDVAAAALALASETAADAGVALPSGHVGYYLIGRGRSLLIQRLKVRETRNRRLLGWVYRYHMPLYLGATGGITLSLLSLLFALGAGWGPGPLVIFGLLLVSLPAISQIAVQLVNYLCTRLLPPRLLPKMSFAKDGIPDQFQTLVVVPMLLVGESNLHQELEKLEIRYLANQDPNLIFGLFSDYADADTPQTAGDGLLQVAIDGITALNQRHGEHRFYLFHRERVWTESEQAYIGWERKRGKLEALNRLISGQERPGQEPIVRVGEAERLMQVRFVITLDSDTQLLRDTARRLVETLAHPLNCPSLDPEVNPDSYTIIQPRITTTPSLGMVTPFRRLFTDPVGTDPYTKAVSDVYQDLAGEGSFIGKGIYDPRVFHKS